jgi:putative ABC transport system substrate-binding protein
LSAFTRELLGKRLELLKEAIPGLARPALLTNFDNPVARMAWEEMSLAASKLRIEPILADVRKPEDMERAFETALKQWADALVVANDTVTQSNLNWWWGSRRNIGYRRHMRPANSPMRED